MNKYTYSASLNAFYPLALKPDYEKAGSWPGDAIEISDEMANEYMAEPPEGKIRAVGDGGYPSWVDAPEPTHEEQVAASDAEKQSRIEQANAYMDSKQWPGKAAMGRLNDTEKAQYNAWLDYLDALEAVHTSTAPDIQWPTQPDVQAS